MRAFLLLTAPRAVGDAADTRTDPVTAADWMPAPEQIADPDSVDPDSVDPDDGA